MIPLPHPMAEKVHFLMLRYDSTSWPRKDYTQMLDVYVGSFFNFEIIMTPRLVQEKNCTKMLNVYLGSF
jgi:hypothetical protein